MSEINFVRKPTVLKRFGISNSQLYKLIQQGDFPVPVKINSSSAWVKSELDEYAERLISSSRNQQWRK